MSKNVKQGKMLFSGIFHNEAENFFVWVNEEDQMRIVSMQKGDAVVEIFNRFATATKAIQEVFN